MGFVMLLSPLWNFGLEDSDEYITNTTHQEFEKIVHHAHVRANS